MKPHVLTRTTSASSPSPRSAQPPAASRAASSSESTSLRAQPSVTRLTVRELDTNRGYVIGHHPHVTGPPADLNAIGFSPGGGTTVAGVSSARAGLIRSRFLRS